MSDRETGADVVIVGGGVAGASLAYFLAERGVGRAVLLEREQRPGFHASGRSAAAQCEVNLDPVIHRLLVEGAHFLRRPPDGFSDRPIFRQTGVLELYDRAGMAEVERQLPGMRERGSVLEILSMEEVRRRHPVVTGGELEAGVWMPECGRLDVSALLAGYLARARRGNVEVRTGTEVVGVLIRGGRCTGVQTNLGPIEADLVVNAAGAWAGQLAKKAAATPIELEPRRRTVVTFPAPPGIDPGAWPLISDEASRIYFAPEGDRLLASPLDEDPSEPCDARPAPEMVAETLRRLSALAPSIAPDAPGGARAGLRTFAPDRRLVLGPDPRRPGFFWLAGQGGWGIETSPAVGRLAAELIDRGASDWPDLRALVAARFARA